ncbi:MgtC/SapB family protein, partial [Candidatus Woesearchaeota archaeon]|nr:MgtC/SapB family protein [Candidatus Woesearchaeota archaeon]
GISTHSFVIGGSMLFTILSLAADPSSPARIAAQIVTGVGFLGAGIILKGEEGKITNLTTAASLWFAAALGMAIGFGWYVMAIIATIYALILPRIPEMKKK